MNLLRAAAAALALCASTSISAAPLNYDESVSGDLGGPILPTFGLDAGQNTIRGSMSGYFQFDAEGQPQFILDFDAVAFSLPAGYRVTSMGIALDVIDTRNVGYVEWDWFVVRGDQSQVSKSCFVLFGTTSECPEGNMSGGPLAFDLSETSTDFYVTFGSSWSYLDPWQLSGAAFDYTLAIDVAKIPEPGTGLLVATMLVVLAAPFRRRRSSALRRFSAR